MQAVTLYEKFGGREGIGTVVDTFYARVLNDPRINQFFANRFLSFALGGPAYTGRSMAAAHRGMNLQPEHFGAVAEQMIAALREHGMAEDDVDAVVAKLLTLKDAVLYQ